MNSFSSIQFGAQPSVCPIGSDQIIDSPDKVPSFENEAAHKIREELCLHIEPSFLACPAQIDLQTAYNLFVPQEAFSCDIRLQTILFERLFLLEQLGQVAFQRNR